MNDMLMATDAGQVSALCLLDLSRPRPDDAETGTSVRPATARRRVPVVQFIPLTVITIIIIIISPLAESYISDSAMNAGSAAEAAATRKAAKYAGLAHLPAGCR